MLRPRGMLVGLALAALVLAAVGGAAVERAAIAAPRATTPASVANVESLPAFGWRAVSGADHYEFQLGADPSFNSPVLGRGRDAFETRNTWATVSETVPNGDYWWHVRAVTKAGAVSAWSPARKIVKNWARKPKLESPRDREVIRFPTSPLVLRWKPVAWAAKYLVFLASDPDLSTLVTRRPVETEGFSYAPSITLANGTYYWAVQPVDAAGNRGTRSDDLPGTQRRKPWRFAWSWLSRMQLRVRDLVDEPQHYDPQFSWDAVPGAARYEVEINPSKDWAVGSKVCCRDPVVTTTLSPTQLLGNNRYYWRVRAINVDGNAGQWNQGQPFTKVFDSIDESVPEMKPPSIKGLHLRDNLTDGASRPAGWATSSPIVVWDSVPGASGYQVDVAPFRTPDRPDDCDWVARKRRDRWIVDTAVPAWTPLGPNYDREPYPARNIRPTNDGSRILVRGQAYCVRVRARTDRDVQRQDVFGDYTYLVNAFSFSGFPAGGGTPNAAESDYLEPARDKTRPPLPETPLFTWKAIPNAASYWVIVAKDASFTNIVDYALTNTPAYAPRRGLNPMTYSDEETLYYWAILPARNFDGSGAPGDPLSEHPSYFRKISQPPAVLLPVHDRTVIGPPTFRWKPAIGAKRYRLQISQDPNFGTLLEELLTNSTAYTATKTYPANAALYMRVRAEDETDIGLSWSVRRKFRNTLAQPEISRDNPSRGDVIPTFTWKYVQGASSYEIHVELPNGSERDLSGLLPAAFTPTEMRGTGVFTWQVRAEFPEARGGKTAVGPYTEVGKFTRTIRPPASAKAIVGRRSLLIQWQPKLGADHYRVEIATSPDFARTIEREDVDGTSFAPDLGGGWERATTFYWRVQAVDASGNSGNYTPVGRFHLKLPSSR